jgi:hypothetical protein
MVVAAHGMHVAVAEAAHGVGGMARLAERSAYACDSTSQADPNQSHN